MIGTNQATHGSYTPPEHLKTSDAFVAGYHDWAMFGLESINPFTDTVSREEWSKGRADAKKDDEAGE